MNDHPRRYVVVSPEFTYTEVVIPETGQGPTEVTRDVSLVEAPTAKAAKWAAYRHWKQQKGESWPRYSRLDQLHPLSGVTAKRVTPDDEEYDPKHWPGQFVTTVQRGDE